MMDIPKTKSGLLSAMEAARREWDRVLSQIDEQALSEPGVEGIWSVKQVVAHVAGYEQWTAAFLTDWLNPDAGILAAYDAFLQEQLNVYRQDHPDFPVSIDETDEDQTNAIVVTVYDQYTAGEVLAREQHTYQQLVTAIQGLSDDQLLEPGVVAGRSIMEILPNQSYGHYQLHLPAIQRWLKQHHRLSLNHE